MSRLEEYSRLEAYTNKYLEKLEGCGNAETYTILAFPYIVDIAKSLAVIADALNDSQTGFEPSEEDIAELKEALKNKELVIEPEMKCKED